MGSDCTVTDMSPCTCLSTLLYALSLPHVHTHVDSHVHTQAARSWLTASSDYPPPPASVDELCVSAATIGPPLAIYPGRLISVAPTYLCSDYRAALTATSITELCRVDVCLDVGTGMYV